MRFASLLTALMILGGLNVTAARAGDPHHHAPARRVTVADTPNQSWIFHRSYYSHDPVRPVQIGRQVTRGPVYTRPQGSYVNSGFRRMYSTIQVGGMTYDNVNVFESWVQTGSQY